MTSISCANQMYIILNHSELSCCQKTAKTHITVSHLHWVTCFFITVNTSSVVYFESFSKYHSVPLYNTANLHLNIACDKFSFYTCLSSTGLTMAPSYFKNSLLKIKFFRNKVKSLRQTQSRVKCFNSLTKSLWILVFSL